MTMRRTVVAVLAALLGVACTPVRDAEWAIRVLEHDPLGPEAATAYR